MEVSHPPTPADVAPVDVRSVAAPVAAPVSPVELAWPRSAQVTTAFLLGVAVTLLGVHAWSASGGGARPSDLQAAPAYRVDLNQAPRAELLQLPGVGPALVERIEAHRRERGGFRSVDELTEVRGIGPATLARLRPWVCVAGDEGDVVAVAAPVVRPLPSSKRAPPTEAAPTMGSPPPGKKDVPAGTTIDVNQASQAELQKLPGIGPKMSQRILDERARKPFKSVDDLRRVSGIGAKTLEKLRPSVRVETAPPAEVVQAE